MTRISVLMPVYNGLPYVREAIESVLIQSFQDWELVISDNGSTDGTRDYLDSLRDPRIRVYKQESNLGIYGNFNFLLEQAEADVAKALCADDWLLPGALERTLQFMEEHPDCVVSRCLARGNPKRYAQHHTLEYEQALPTHLKPAAAFLAHVMFGNLVGNLSQAAVRPKPVLGCGGFNQRSYPICGDYEGWARITQIYGLCLQNEELVYERAHPEQSHLLLNRRNESFLERNHILKMWETEVSRNDLADLKLVKRHWTIHHLSWRVPIFIRQILAGRPGIARTMWQDLPSGISSGAVFAAYPVWKFNLSPARATARRLLDRILEINKKT